MRKLFPFLLFIVLLSSFASAVIITEEINFAPSLNNVTYVSPDYNVTCTEIYVNNTCLVLTGCDMNVSGTYCASSDSAITIPLLPYYTTAPNILSSQSTSIALVMNESQDTTELNATVTWNGTAYTVTETVIGVQHTFSTTINGSDTIVNSNSDIPIVWNVEWANATDNEIFNITDSQYIEYWNFFQCNSTGNVSLIFNVYDEEYPTTYLDATLNFNSQFWYESGTAYLNYSTNMNGNSTYYLCLDPTNQTLKANFTIYYNTTNGFSHKYIEYNATLTNTSRTISIYNFNRTDTQPVSSTSSTSVVITPDTSTSTTTSTSDYNQTTSTDMPEIISETESYDNYSTNQSYSNTTTPAYNSNSTVEIQGYNQTTISNVTGYNTSTTSTTTSELVENDVISSLKITVRYEGNYSYYIGAVSKLQRWYPAENVWRTVQMDETGDFGTLYYHVIEKEVDYRLAFFDRNNVLLRQTDKLKFICTNYFCDLTVTIDDSSSSSTWVADDFTASSVYNNLTGIITVTWNDPNLDVDNVSIVINFVEGAKTTSICYYSSVSTSGTYECDVSTYEGTISVRVSKQNSPEQSVLLTWYQTSYLSLSSLNGISLNEQAFWAFGIVLTMAAAGIVSPVALIISAVMGMLIVSYFGLFYPVTIPVMAGLVALAIFTMFVYRRGQ